MIFFEKKLRQHKKWRQHQKWRQHNKDKKCQPRRGKLMFAQFVSRDQIFQTYFLKLDEIFYSDGIPREKLSFIAVAVVFIYF